MPAVQEANAKATATANNLTSEEVSYIRQRRERKADPSDVRRLRDDNRGQRRKTGSGGGPCAACENQKATMRCEKAS